MVNTSNMREVTNFKDTNFRSWNNIHDGHGKRLSSFWGKAFWYRDEKTNKTYVEILGIFQRILRAISSYKNYLNKENLWKFLSPRPDFTGDCPASKVFRKTVGGVLANQQKDRDDLFAALRTKNPASHISDFHPFRAALYRSKKENIIKMFEDGKVDVNVVNNSGYPIVKFGGSLESALTTAIRHSKYKVANYLIGKGAVFGTTPKAISLRELIGRIVPNEPNESSKGRVELIALLIDSGKFDLTEKGAKTGYNLLHTAVWWNKMEVVKALLASPKKGELINAQATGGSTPLQLACNNTRFDVARLLLNNGAAPSAGALSRALSSIEFVQKKDLKQAIETRLALVDLFVAKGLKLEGEIGSEMLNRAAQSGDKALVEKVLNKFPNLTAPSGAITSALGSVPRGWEPITQRQRIIIAKFLIEKGAKLDDAYPQYLVRNAAVSGEKYILAYLFESNSELRWLADTKYNIDQYSSRHPLVKKYPTRKLTLLQLAEWYKRTKIVDYLNAELKKACEKEYGKPEEPKPEANKPEGNAAGEKVPPQANPKPEANKAEDDAAGNNNPEQPKQDGKQPKQN